MTITTARTMGEIEAEIDATRDRLAATIDALAARANPQSIAERQWESAKVKAYDALVAEDGELRTQRVAIMAGVAVALIALAVWRRRS